HLSIDDHMRPERPSRVRLGAEQDRLPKRGDPRNVGLKIEMRDVGEDEADHRIAQRSRIERAHQPFTVITILDVHERGWHTHEDRDGALRHSTSAPRLAITEAMTTTARMLVAIVGMSFGLVALVIDDA